MIEGEVYEECPVCDGIGVEADYPCAWCEGSGLVPHNCEAA